jgi:Calcineurin-like phosphoesterase
MQGRAWTRRPAVAWFSIQTLVRSAIESRRLKKFGQLADGRQAQASSPMELYDFSEYASIDGQFTIDYVADTGDGFDTTWAVARSVSGELASATAPNRRADLLLLGGDEVYPIARIDEYNNRLKLPFEIASGKRVEGYVAAIPGNHDWYDGLSAFRRNFCESYLDRLTPKADGVQVVRPHAVATEALLQRRAFQSRSYFAIRLPHRWWVWGVDAQLDNYIDTPQLEYFQRCRETMTDQDRVILCFPRPSWTDPVTATDGRFAASRETTIWFWRRFFGAPGSPRVRLMISGDRHHYAHYVLHDDHPAPQGDPVAPSTVVTGQPPPERLVTCGGGGAFLSSTHHNATRLSVAWNDGDQPATEYDLTTAYPTESESKALRSRFWRIPIANGPGLPILLALLGLMSLSFAANWESARSSADFRLALGAWSLAVVGALILVSYVFRPGPASAWWSLYPATVHCVLYLAAILGAHASALWLGARLGDAIGLSEDPAYLIAAIPITTLLVWLSLAVYFRVCDSLPGKHWHESEFFSAMGITAYKGHLRITVRPAKDGTGAGRMHVQMFGIDDPPRGNINREPADMIDPETRLVDEFDVTG